MGKLKVMIGDIFTIGKEKNAVIIHGANCFKTMGAGVAGQVAQHYPEAYDVDLLDDRSPEEKFGNFTFHDFGDYVIANAYTQFQPGANFDYEAIQKALIAVRDKFPGRTFVMPEIGSGIAGGDANIIRGIMSVEFTHEDAILVKWDGQ